jgi:hypothetical protein
LFARRRLRLEIIPPAIEQCIACDKGLDKNMEHGFCCQKMGHGNLHHVVKMATFKALREIARHIGDDVLLEPSVQPHMRDMPINYNEKGELINRRGDIALSNIVPKTQIVIDVRTCAMTQVSTKEGSVVAQGEKLKLDYYKEVCEFPDTVTSVPFAIDTYGRWGEEFKRFLASFCRAAAGTGHEFYNLLITRARSMIQVAHTVAIGSIIMTSMDECVSCADRFILARRTGKASKARQV